MSNPRFPLSSFYPLLRPEEGEELMSDQRRPSGRYLPPNSHKQLISLRDFQKFDFLFEAKVRVLCSFGLPLNVS